MSATFDTYQKKLLRLIFEIEKESILEFPNQLTLSNGYRSNNFTLDSVVKKTVDEICIAVLEKISHDFHEYPFILFHSIELPGLNEKLKALCEQNDEPFV